MKEVWKDIEGYEGCYQISSLSRVRSLDRVITHGSNVGIDKNFRYKGKILKQPVLGNGYKHVMLLIAGKSKLISVHRLVAINFIDNPDSKDHVDHINTIKTDNRIENLRWVWSFDHPKISVGQGVLPTGENSYLSYLTTKQVNKIRELYNTNKYTQSELANMFKSKRSTIQGITSGRNRKYE
jgi:hypothetical protein